MRKKDCAYLIAVLLAGVALGLVAGLGVAGVAYPIYQSDKWAAWVQAFGSIGAILAAMQISRAETQRQKINSINEAKIKLILESESIYETHDSLRKASKAASDYSALWVSQGASGNPAFHQHMIMAGNSLANTIELAKKISWELFLVAMPEKTKEVRQVLSGLAHLKRQTILQGLITDEVERDRVHSLLAAYEDLLRNEEFITLDHK